MATPVIHFEIIAADGDKAREFYGNLFGWTFNTDNPLQYGAANTGAGETAIGGGVSGPYPQTTDTYVTFYVMVPDIEATLAKVEDSGGETAFPPMNLSESLKMAQFIDPDGLRVGLLQQI